MKVLLHPVSDTDGEFRFAHSYRASLVFGIVSAAGSAMAWLWTDGGTTQVVVGGGSAMLALKILASGFYRYELVLDLRERRWRRRTGFVFAPSREEGSLDDLRGVVLTRRQVGRGTGSGRKSVPLWLVSLEFAGPAWDGPLVIGMADQESAGHALLEDYARRFQVDAVDRTSDDEVRREWDALDRPLATGDVADPTAPEDGSARTTTLAAAPVGAATATPAQLPPVGSGIDVSMEDGQRRITLPPAGIGISTVFGFVFGLPFTGIGIYLVWYGATAAIELPLFTAVVGGVFAFIGSSMMWSAAARTRAREWIIDAGDRLRFGTTGPSGTRSRSEVLKRFVEEVSIRSSAYGGGTLHIMGVRVRTPANRAGVVSVRSDGGTVRVGRRLSPEGKSWLRDALTAMVRVPSRTNVS